MGDAEHPKIWSLPKNLLVHISPFFAAALNGSFAEASSKTITLPEDDPAAFEMFVQWMYVGKTGRNSTEDIAIHVESWILGDKLGCPVFQDRAMLKLLHLHSANLIQPKTLQLAYEGSAAGSKLRKWALQHFIYNVQYENFVENLENWAAVAKAIADFGSDYVAASAATFKNLWFNPIENGQLYLEILAYKDERLDKKA